VNELCGCCTSEEPPVPVQIDNRPGLSAVAFRIGTFGSFRQTLLGAIAGTPELAGLRTRLSDDYSVTLLELWAAVADILTFYQERLANEGFLRTAQLRDSVLRMVRLLGYQLRPGAAATARLAFTLEPHARLTVSAGLRVQSVPGAGEQPQKFETLQAIEADARFNQLRIVPTPIPATPLARGRTEGFLAPGRSTLATLKAVTAGDRIVVYRPDAMEVLTVRELRVQDDQVILAWAGPLQADDGYPDAVSGDLTTAGVFRIGRTFRIFGSNAPATYVTAVPVVAAGSVTAITVTNGGTGYATAPTVAITGGGGSGATAVATVVSGVVTAITVTDDGAGYTTAPTVAIRGGGGSGASATATIAAGVTGPQQLQTTSTDFTLTGDGSNGRDQLFLDGRYENVTPGTELLVVAKGITGASAVQTKRVRVTAVAQGRATRGPLTDTVTQLTVTGDPRDFITDVGGVVLYELLDSQLRFWPFAYPHGLVSSDLYVPGRRSGWDRIEVGRTLEKRGFQPGVEIRITEFDPGRPVLLLDAGGRSVGAKIEGAELFGASIAVGATATDSATLTDLGLGPDQAQRVTALLTRRLAEDLRLTNHRPEMQVSVGAFPPQTVALGDQPPPPDMLEKIAGGLQFALRKLSTATTFQEARVLLVDDCLVVLPGVPEDAVSFGPTAADTTTITQLRLEPAQARYIDGVRSAPIGTVPTTRSGHLRVFSQLDPPQEVTVSLVQGADTSQVVGALGHALGLDAFSMRVTSDEQHRLLILPPVPRDEARDYLRLTVAPDAPIDLDAVTAVLLGNVASASHGESVHSEIVGDGDASQAFQHFVLRKKPVTFVPAAVPGGVASSLTLLVNGVQWSEASTFYGAGPRDEIFVTGIADDGTMTARFGDGAAGARPPTGRSNVVASYRQGIGLAGRVRANTLTTLLDRPTGLKAGTNPVAADGGADPESLERARHAAPGTIRTFGRAVSLGDFQDVALASGEVAKARATWVWAGATRAVYLTVAAQQGAMFSAEGLQRIRATLDVERDLNHPLLIANYVAVPILVSAALRVGDRYIRANVLATARAALLASLAFDSLDFAQSINLSDIYRVLQQVPGVAWVDVETLDFKSQDAVFRTEHGATAGQPQPHLRILPARAVKGLPLRVLPAELAAVDVPSQDVVLRASGGVSV
jgi:hypothetical protein